MSDCNREVAGSNLGLGYFAPRSTQPSILPGSVNEYQLAGKAKAWLIPIADVRVGVQVKISGTMTHFIRNSTHIATVLRFYTNLPLSVMYSGSVMNPCMISSVRCKLISFRSLNSI